MSRDDWAVILGGALFAFLFLCGVALAAPRLPDGVDCATVRAAVAEHGRIRAIRWAREQGYSWTQISEARKCLR